jgi:redox-sensing transcriptional repressor
VASQRRIRAASDQVSELTTARISVYLRCLDELDAEGARTTSSRELAERFHLNADQIRKDLANFGGLGVRGVGYSVTDLRGHLRHILGLDRHVKLVIIGAGNLGLALADYPGFREDSFDVVSLFDVVPGKVGHRSRGGIVIRHIDELGRVVERDRVDIAMIAVPAAAAQEVVDLVVRAGVRAVLNFAPATLRVPDGVRLKSVDLSVSLESLSFYLARGTNGPI